MVKKYFALYDMVRVDVVEGVEFPAKFSTLRAFHIFSPPPEFGDCRRCLAVVCDSRTFLRRCGHWTGLYTSAVIVVVVRQCDNVDL